MINILVTSILILSTMEMSTYSGDAYEELMNAAENGTDYESDIHSYVMTNVNGGKVTYKQANGYVSYLNGVLDAELDVERNNGDVNKIVIKDGRIVSPQTLTKGEVAELVLLLPPELLMQALSE